MTIDKRKKFWRGTEAADLEEYLRAFTEQGYPAVRFAHAACKCGHPVFALEANDEQGVARRRCAACGAVAGRGDGQAARGLRSRVAAATSAIR